MLMNKILISELTEWLWFRDLDHLFWSRLKLGTVKRLEIHYIPNPTLDVNCFKVGNNNVNWILGFILNLFYTMIAKMFQLLRKILKFHWYQNVKWVDLHKEPSEIFEFVKNIYNSTLPFIRSLELSFIKTPLKFSNFIWGAYFLYSILSNTCLVSFSSSFFVALLIFFILPAASPSNIYGAPRLDLMNIFHDEGFLDQSL